MKNEDVARFVMNYKDKKFANVARDLCFEAIILGSSDNITAQVVDLRKPQLLQQSSS
jgi:serine/threonine protein phosphatase PrpC